MKICYYPGCTLKTQAKELDRYARVSALALGVEMEEIENYPCVGILLIKRRYEVLEYVLKMFLHTALMPLTDVFRSFIGMIRVEIQCTLLKIQMVLFDYSSWM